MTNPINLSEIEIVVFLRFLQKYPKPREEVADAQI